MIKLMKYLLKKYMWIYERDNGDRGFVLAKDRDEAIKKLCEYYTDAAKRIAETDKGGWMDNNWMYLFDANGIEINKDIYITEAY